jgi:hypothetical protein
MKMRWWMIVPIHTNHDAEEFADGGHVGRFGSRCDSAIPGCSPQLTWFKGLGV